MHKDLPRHIILLLFCTVYVAAFVCDDIFKYTHICTCAESMLYPDTLNCSGLDIKLVPVNLPLEDQVISLDLSNNFLAPNRIHEVCKYQLHTLSLAGNRISSLPDNQFENCSVIDTLDMSNNDIDKLSQGSFTGLYSLKNLIGVEARKIENFAFAKLTSLESLTIITHQMPIPSNLFNGLKLKNLDFRIHGALELPDFIFDNISSTLTSLTISSNSLEWLRPSQLAKLTNLTSFTLSCSSLRMISPDLLKVHYNLESIYFTGMVAIPRNIFSRLDHHLKVLTLRDLEDMPSVLFESLFSLRYLDIGKCRVPTIPDGWFNDLFNLTTLILENNGINELTIEDFRNMQSLKVLDLSHNNIRELPDNVFTEVIKTVEKIDLSHNKIRGIVATHFQGAVRLKVLSLSHNQLRFIENGSFRELVQLRELNLESNYLKIIQPNMLEQSGYLESLDLSSNSITEMPGKLLQDTASLHILDISENEVSYIGNSSMYPTETLTSLDLSYNPFYCDCELYALRLAAHTADIHGTCKERGTMKHIKYFVPDQYCDNIKSMTKTLTLSINQPITRSFYSRQTISTITTMTLTSEDTGILGYTETGQDADKTKGQSTEIHMVPDLNITAVSHGNNTIHPNLTVEEIVNYHPVSEQSYKIAIGCVVGVVVLIVMVIFLIIIKRRRGRRYEVSRTNFSGEGSSMEPAVTPLKHVPSIQIEKVDAHDNVKVEIYQP